MPGRNEATAGLGALIVDGAGNVYPYLAYKRGASWMVVASSLHVFLILFSGDKVRKELFFSAGGQSSNRIIPDRKIGTTGAAPLTDI